MKVAFRNRFYRDVKKIKDPAIRANIQRVIETTEQVDCLEALTDVKKLRGAEDCFRIRVGDYRIGVVKSGGVIEFACCMHRREMYRYFP